MAWHKFIVGRQYSVSEVVDVCVRYINSGKTSAPRNPGEKLRHVELIRKCGLDFIVYSPESKAGWGNSPMNQNCWTMINGEPICKWTVVARNL